MKFFLAVAASLASSAAAAASPAPVYILSSSSSSPSSSSPSSSSAAPPSVPREVARQILLQRLAATDAASFFDELPRGYDADSALDLVQQFGVAAPLFADKQPGLLLVVEGATDAHLASAAASLAGPAFTVADPPSQAANAALVAELASAGIVASKDVAADTAMTPNAWADGALVALYDAKRDATAVDAILAALASIADMAAAGDADVTLLLLPESSRRSKAAVWANKSTKAKSTPPPPKKIHELRSDETVFSEDADASFDADFAATTFAKTSSSDASSFKGTLKAESDDTDADASAASLADDVRAKGPIPACFASFNSCTAATNACSGHGTCVDKFAVNSGGVAGKTGASCFVCHCVSTLNRPEDAEGGLSTTQWAGSMCHKVDVSVPFWLITGFTVAIIGAVAFAIGLLFSVGEEKLPGVIGAGVSRSK